IALNADQGAFPYGCGFSASTGLRSAAAAGCLLRFVSCCPPLCALLPGRGAGGADGAGGGHRGTAGVSSALLPAGAPGSGGVGAAAPAGVGARPYPDTARVAWSGGGASPQ